MSSSVYLESLTFADHGNPENPHSLEIGTFPSIVGRSPECDYRICNPLVSRRHCYFFERGNEIWVRDLDSQNGTRLNGEVVVREKPIHEGDELEIGYLTYRVHGPAKPAFGRFSPHGDRRKPSILDSLIRQLASSFQKPTPA
jgi:predicted component of type VI protein secretion system